MDWTGSRSPPALAGSDEGAVVNDERPGQGAGVSGASSLALGALVVSKPHMLPLFYRRWMSPARPWWKCWPEPLNTCSPTQVRVPASRKGSAPTPQRPCVIQESPSYQSIGEHKGSQNWNAQGPADVRHGRVQGSTGVLSTSAHCLAASSDSFQPSCQS